MPNRTEAVQRKLRHMPPGDYRYCACSRLHRRCEAGSEGSAEQMREPMYKNRIRGVSVGRAGQ
jgi:hypothetical protein